MLIECGTKISGHYKIEVVDSVTGVIKQSVCLDNLIPDSGLDFLANGDVGTGGHVSTLFQYLETGTGTNPPNVTETRIEQRRFPISAFVYGNEVANPLYAPYFALDTADLTGTNNNPLYVYWRRTLYLPENMGNGSFTEIGLYSFYALINIIGSLLASKVDAYGPLGSHVLTTDILGNIAAINKTASDRLRVQFELRMYPFLGDVTGSQIMSGSVVDYTIRAQGVGLSNWQNALPNMGSWQNAYAYAHQSQVLTPYTTTNNPVPKVLADSVTVGSWVPGQHYRDLTFGWSPQVAQTGVGLITVSPWTAGDGNQLWQIYFNPVIQKTSWNKLSVTLRQYIGRV